MSGGSGIVIISYVTADFGTCSVTGAGNAITTSGSNSIATFIVSGDFVCVTGGSGPANLKSFNGLAKASIKSINGLAIGSIKSVNGLA